MKTWLLPAPVACGTVYLLPWRLVEGKLQKQEERLRAEMEVREKKR